ncbi:tRNA intron endonuclease, catalytic domain-like [Dillenia turbinata]|uniref:tRNA-intron lyase n=1 Tax=Dillenia turbinata TaxID=194707 RepID=A0AAN8VKS4_9MAGN
MIACFHRSENWCSSGLPLVRRRRSKNWVVRPGLQYGGNFVAHRHHPSFVHPEYVVLVSLEENGDANGRLRRPSSNSSSSLLAHQLCKSYKSSKVALGHCSNEYNQGC